jgi:hypothetical protein
MFAEGRVSPHSDELHIVERYRRLNKNTLEIEATINDPDAHCAVDRAETDAGARALRSNHVAGLFGLGNSGSAWTALAKQNSSK